MEVPNEAQGAVDISELKGKTRGGCLGPGRVLFRAQAFYQELLPTHVSPGQLEFSMGLDAGGKNYARLPLPSSSPLARQAPGEVSDEDPRLVAAATCVPEHTDGPEDSAEVAELLRLTASWGSHAKVRRLLASTHAPPSSCARALCIASQNGHEAVVGELLRARALPDSDDGGNAGKRALHFACENGHEAVARMLLMAKADLSAKDCWGRTACELARDQDLGSMAKRLEKFVADGLTS